jgi:hypothetical protein
VKRRQNPLARAVWYSCSSSNAALAVWVLLLVFERGSCRLVLLLVFEVGRSMVVIPIPARPTVSEREARQRRERDGAAARLGD